MKKSLLVLFVLSNIIFAKQVTVSIVPQKYFVKKIAKDKIKVNVMVPPGSSPATYEPKASQMRDLSKSEAYFFLRMPFSKPWLSKFQAANENMLMVDTTHGIKRIPMVGHHHHGEHHEKEHDDHEHKGMVDPHIFLDPVLVKIQAKTIYETLVKIDNPNKAFYKKNYKLFIKELNGLNSKIKNILKPYKNKPFMVFHPAWGYFSKRYGLKQIPIEMEGKEPKPKQLAKLVEEAEEHNIKIVFVSPQFSQAGAKAIARSIHGKTAVINPLSYKWENNLIKVAKSIASTYK